jgi:hypothetical protein
MFGASPGEYFAMNTLNVYEKRTIPAKAPHQVRVIAAMDSTVIPGNLAVTSGQHMNATKLIQDWWTNVGNSKLGIKASTGNAEFKTASGQSKIVPFDGKFGRREVERAITPKHNPIEDANPNGVFVF